MVDIPNVNYFKEIADAIRNAGGDTALIQASQFPVAIDQAADNIKQDCEAKRQILIQAHETEKELLLQNVYIDVSQALQGAY